MKIVTSWKPILGLLAAHLVLGLTLYQFQIISDGHEYVQMATNLRATGVFSFDGIHPVVGKPPGLPALLAAYESIVGSFSGFQIVQLLFLFGAYLFVAETIAGAWNPRAGIVAVAVLVAVDPLRQLAANALTEPVFLFLTALGMWSVLQMDRGGRLRYGMIAGIAFSCSTYVRPLNLFWPAALLAVAIVFRSLSIKSLVAVLIIHILLIAPWAVRNSQILGSPVPFVANWGPLYVMSDAALWETFSRKGWAAVFTERNYPETLGHQYAFNPAPAETLRVHALANIKTDPLGFLKRCAGQAIFVWTYVPGTKEWQSRAPTAFWFGRAVMVLFYGLCLLGSIRLWRTERWLIVVGAAYATYTGAIHFFVTTESRYLLGAYLWLLPLAALGVMFMVSRYRRIATPN
jgi:hypothetical protein